MAAGRRVMTRAGDSFAVGGDVAGIRLDAFLVRLALAPNVAAARRAIAHGLVRVDDRRAKKGQRLLAGQMVTVDTIEVASAVPVALPELPLSVIHEDADLLAVDKPAGLPTHPLRGGNEPSVAAALLARYPECETASPDPREGGLGHRLDRGTSGVLFAARNRHVWHALRGALSSGDCAKVYRAEVTGRPPVEPPSDPFVTSTDDRTGLVVSAPIGRQGRRGKKVKIASGRNPLPARTEVRLIEVRGEISLVEARLSRGRAHQVRVHLAYLGCPIVGDSTYGSVQVLEGGGFHLHALSVTLRHPSTGTLFQVQAPLPDWAKNGG